MPNSQSNPTLRKPGDGGSTDFSDVGLNGANLLPTRTQRVLVPTPAVEVNARGQFIDQQAGLSDDMLRLAANQSPSALAELIEMQDYCTVRIEGRGLNTDGTPSPNLSAYYRFLVNPSAVRPQRQTVDAQALTHAGWAYGVWGEGFVEIGISGRTPGSYFHFGPTDKYREWTLSYRNVLQLQLFTDNNGFFYEDEQQTNPLASSYSGTRRRIKAQQDVEFKLGNFTWYGTFESFQLRQSADNPFTADFDIQFCAWREQSDSASPWNVSTLSSAPTYLGHDRAIFGGTSATTLSRAKAAQASNQPASVSSAPPQEFYLPPAQNAASFDSFMSQVSGNGTDVSDLRHVLNLGIAGDDSYWNNGHGFDFGSLGF